MIACWKFFTGFIAIIPLLLVNCGTDQKNHNARTSFQGNQTDNTKPDAGDDNQSNELQPIDQLPDEPTSSEQSPELTLTSIQAFEATVYPIVRQYCVGGCHDSAISPTFALEDPEKAHEVILGAKKIDFAIIENSRVVKQLQAQHNCWSDCDQNANEMISAITTWKEKLAQNNSQQQDQNPNDGFKLSSPLLFANAVKKQVNDNGTFTFEAEAGTIQNPMAIRNNANASKGQIVITPNGTGNRNNANDQTAGIVRFAFEVTKPGDYRIHVRALAPTANDNSIFVRMDNNAAITWNLTVNANLQNALVSVNNQPSVFNLAAGLHTLEFKHREDGVGLDVVTITNNPNFDPNNPQPLQTEIPVLRFDLSSLVNTPEVFLEIEMVEFDEKSYKFKNPTLVTPKALKIKNVRILLNNKFDPSNATYTLIDKTVNAPSELLSQAALVILKEKSITEDQVSVAFEVLE